MAPGLAYLQVVLGQVLLADARFDGARNALVAAMDLDPEDAQPLALLATVELCDNRLDRGLAAAKQGLRLDPDNKLCATLCADAQLLLGNLDQARQLIQGVLRTAPDDVTANVVEGRALLQTRHYEEALAPFQRAFDCDPSNDAARAGLANALRGVRYAEFRLLTGYFDWLRRLSSWWCVPVLLGLIAVSQIRAPHIPDFGRLVLAGFLLLPFMFVVLLLPVVALGIVNAATWIDPAIRPLATRGQVATSVRVAAVPILATFYVAGAIAGIDRLPLALGTVAASTLTTLAYQIYTARQGLPRFSLALYFVLTLLATVWALQRVSEGDLPPALLVGVLLLVGLISGRLLAHPFRVS